MNDCFQKKHLVDFSTPCSQDLSRGELTKSGCCYPPRSPVGLQTQSLRCRTALRVWKGHGVQHDTVLEMLLLPFVSKLPSTTAWSQPVPQVSHWPKRHAEMPGTSRGPAHPHECPRPGVSMPGEGLLLTCQLDCNFHAGGIIANPNNLSKPA